MNNWVGVRLNQIEIQAEPFCKWGCWKKKKRFVSWDLLQTYRQEALQLVHATLRIIIVIICSPALRWMLPDPIKIMGFMSPGPRGGWWDGKDLHSWFLLFPTSSLQASQPCESAAHVATRGTSQLVLLQKRTPQHLRVSRLEAEQGSEVLS